jgi:hypothetical protein
MLPYKFISGIQEPKIANNAIPNSAFPPFNPSQRLCLVPELAKNALHPHSMHFELPRAIYQQSAVRNERLDSEERVRARSHRLESTGSQVRMDAQCTHSGSGAGSNGKLRYIWTR